MLYEAIKTHDETNLKKALDAGENLFEKQAIRIYSKPLPGIRASSLI